jgi:hypothetical protein
MNRFLPICLTIVVVTTVLSADDAKSTVAKLNKAWLDAYKAADLYHSLYVPIPIFRHRGQHARRK